MKKKISLSTQVIIAVILAIAAGLLLGEKMTVLAPIGNIFLSLIKTLVIPLVFCSICGAVCNMQDMSKLRSVGGKVLALFVITTSVAAAIGIVVSEVMHIGVGLDYSTELMEDVGEVPGVLEVILNMFPSNIVSSMAEGNNLQVIIFAVLLGCAIIVTGKEAETFKKGINSLISVLYSLTGIVMKFSPVGIFCLLGNAIGEHGAEVFSAIGSYILAVYISCIIVLAFDVVLAKVFGKVSVKEFLKVA